MSKEQDTQRVSETYRDIAKETSPANLDDKILAMARQEARTRYGLARAWIRPVAWAATIGLSFAFILEMTYFSDDAPPMDASVPASADGDAAPPAAPPASKRAPATAVTAPEIKASEMPALREAEERAEQATAGYLEDAPAAELRMERASRQRADTIEHCSAEARKDADTWYRCVLALREQGLEEAAEAELGALREAFPNFREPVPE
jgi:hypothetical protein